MRTPSQSGNSRQQSAKHPLPAKKPSGKTVTPEQRQQLIAEAAYRMAEARGFAGECQLDDWLQAEAMVEQQLSGTPSN